MVMVIPQNGGPIQYDFLASLVQQDFDQRWMARKIKEIHSNQVTLTHWEDI